MIKLRFLICASIATIGFVSYFFIAVTLEDRASEKIGTAMAKAIDDYHSNKGTYPTGDEEFIKELGCNQVCYRKDSEKGYILWYGKSLGESCIYDPVSQKWK